jgi:NAD(P)H dehydrogenase (quinone)
VRDQDCFYVGICRLCVKVVSELAKTLLVVYYSEEGKTETMAENIAEGAKASGLNVKLKRAEDCSVGDLVEADGIALGSPTYFSNMAWQVKKLIDESIAAYETTNSLKNKVGTCFTSAGSRRDGKQCVKMLELALGFHHKMKLVSGIVSDASDTQEELQQSCKVQGKRIAEQLR